MFMKNYNLLFTTTLILGSLMAISANSWFTSWLGLEINLMSMTPLILNSIKQNLTEGAIKYFMIQAISSLLLITSVTFNMHSLDNLNMEISETLVFLTLIMKSGLPPFHFWFPQLLDVVNFTQMLLLMTWQKMAPLLLMTYLISNKLILIAILTTLAGAAGGLNQKKLTLILAYSSISHSGWMLIAASLNFLTWVFYFLIYTLMSWSIIYPMSLMNMKKINSLANLHSPQTMKITLSMNLLSLGGMPPFLGFIPKILIILILIFNSLNLVSLFFITPAVLSLYYYTRLIYTFLLNKSTKKQITTAPNKLNNAFLTSNQIFFGLLPTIYFLT